MKSFQREKPVKIELPNQLIPCSTMMSSYLNGRGFKKEDVVPF